jgi:hypothetical protein
MNPMLGTEVVKGCVRVAQGKRVRGPPRDGSEFALCGSRFRRLLPVMLVRLLKLVREVAALGSEVVGWGKSLGLAHLSLCRMLRCLHQAR